jgi:tRNA threonylcarbamoyladenosine biosynthesis protein TsaE
LNPHEVLKVYTVKILIKDKKHLATAARELLKHYGHKKVFAFYGSMGAGKTTFIKALCENLGAVDIVSSPTFTLVNEYKTTNGNTIYHIDFYRIKKLSEVFDFGVEEYLNSDCYCFMEWPELVEEILPEETLKVRISVDENDARTLLI